MAVYTYLACDLLTNQVLDELPLHGVTFDRLINKAGNFGGSTNLDNERLSNDAVKAATVPGRTALYIYRDDQIIWGGIIWTRVYQSQAKSLQLTAQSFESYAYARVYKLSTAKLTYNDRQTVIIRSLWERMQSFDNSNIGVLIPDVATLPANDVVRQLTVNPWDFKKYGEYIDDPLMNFWNSAEWTIECFEEAGTPTKRLILGYPQLGISMPYSEMVLQYPGNILNYYWTENAANSVNRAWATGDGDGADIKFAFAEKANFSGYPLLEDVYNHQGVTVQATIDNHAIKDLNANTLPRIGKTIQLKADEAPTIFSNSIGDEARLYIDDPWHGVLDTTVRVVGWNVTPSSSDSVEEVTVVLEGDESEVAA
jgi:hypothetical protein